MGRSLKVDWDPIAIAYNAGATADELGEKYGIPASTIRQRASRKGWAKKASKKPVDDPKIVEAQSGTKMMPKRPGGVSTLQEIALRDKAHIVANQFQAQKEQFLASGAQVALTGMRKVAECMESESNIYTIGQLGEIGESFTRIAKPVFGLDSANVSVNLATQVNILSDLPPETLDWDAK